MLMIISAYALFSVITNSFYHNILVGMIVLLALVIFYIKDVKMGYKTLKNLKAFDKIKRN